MIDGKDIYDVLAAVVPLYVAMVLAYGSVRWWKVFTPDQCSGINRFVAVYAVPLLSFHFISTNNIYAMNYRFIAADSLQKVVVLAALFLCHYFGGGLDWSITLFSLATLPNTLVMGIPLLRAMYGDFSGGLMVQIVVLQSVIWYNLMLFLFEYRGAKALIAEQFPADVAGSIASFRVEHDVFSLGGREPLQADAEVGRDGKVHVMVRRSTSSSASSMASSHNKSHGLNSIAPMTPRASNLTGMEIYSVQSSRVPTPRASSFNQTDYYSMSSSCRLTSPQTSTGLAFEEEFPGPGKPGGKHRGTTGSKISDFLSGVKRKEGGSLNAINGNKDQLHMYVWSSTDSPSSEANLRNAVNKAASIDIGIMQATSGDASIPVKEAELDEEDAQKMESSHHQMPPASVMTRLILIMVWRKLIRNPNTYSTLLGLIWSLVSFRWNIEMPTIIKGSISILSDAGIGMAMFSLGLFMALQPKIIACGKSVAVFSMAVRFLTGPAVIAATSIAIGVRGVLLHVAIVQAALPEGIVPFVFAKEYNCHPDVRTQVIFGMLIALPITILYYVLLGL